jgi:hypothetical protein
MPIFRNIFVLLAVGALLSPGIPIVIAWAHSVAFHEMWNIVPLSAATFSFVWLIVLGWHPVMVSAGGGYYMERPFTVICANLLVMLACAALAPVKSSRPSLSVVIACVMVAVLWTSIIVIQSRISK